MDFALFPIGATNIFPLANSTAGGQLLTEYNLRSRESVETDPAITYYCGPSFTHSTRDFEVQLDNTNPNDQLIIKKGRAVINGHFVELLQDIVISMTDVKHKLALLGEPTYEGQLAIGIRAMYSTETTMAGAMLPEYFEADGTSDAEEAGMYRGLHVVILPISQFKCPEDVPTNQDKVTAHLKLAEFEYKHNVITQGSLKGNPDMVKSVDAARIKNIDQLISKGFVRQPNLNPNRLYVYDSRASQESGGWCDAIDSLMVWDSNPTLGTSASRPQLPNEAYFTNDTQGRVLLVMPHKQLDENYDASGNYRYFLPKEISLPKADYLKNTPGTVDAQYTKKIKEIEAFVNDLKSAQGFNAAGRMRRYLPTLTDRNDLPSPQGQGWSVGDFVLVQTDETVSSQSEGIQPPSTIYIVVDGYVGTIGNIEEPPADGILIAETQGTGEPVSILLYQEWMEAAKAFRDICGTVDASITSDYSKVIDNPQSTMEQKTSAAYRLAQLMYTSNTDVDWQSIYQAYIAAEEAYQPYIGVETAFGELSQYRGKVGKDYFKYIQTDVIPNKVFYFVVTTNLNGAPVAYPTYDGQIADPILLTGEIGLATESRIGGFKNVPESALDYGYVRLDDAGHLRIVDYDLLRAGVLAYQLGQDIEIAAGLTVDEIQVQLDEFVNNRVAFPNAEQRLNYSNSTTGRDDIINITVHLDKQSSSDETGDVTLKIGNIDSRFGTAVHLHITGTADEHTRIDIVNCEKLILDISALSSDPASRPVIYLDNCNLYYDAGVMNMLIHENLPTTTRLKLWYEKLKDDDPELMVDGLTVSTLSKAIVAESINWHSQSSKNDNHYSYALKSITFNEDGIIVKSSLYMQDNTTSSYITGKSTFAAGFELPQGTDLQYPEKRLLKPIKIAGSFISGYKPDNSQMYIVAENTFCAKSQYYQLTESSTNLVKGTIVFRREVDEMPVNISQDITNPDVLDAFETSQYTIFSGEAIY